MTPQEFMENFGTLADAPGGIKKLRELVLELAATGRLVGEPPETNGSTVSDFISFVNGYAFKSEWFAADGVRLVRNVNVSHGRLVWQEEARLKHAKVAEFERFALQEGDIVVSLDRPIISTGVKVARLTKEDLPALLLQRVAKVVVREGMVLADFFFVWLNSPCFVGAIDPGRSNGVPHISTKEIEKIPFAPPSLASQKATLLQLARIMALLDDLEAKQGKRQHTVVRATSACLDALTTADSPEEVADAWKRVAGNWRVLFGRPEAVEELRQLILDLATRGMVTTQSLSDEPAQSLLQRIVRARNAMKAGSTSAETAFPAELPTPHGLPESWCWASLEVLTDPVRTIRYGILMPGPDLPSGPLYVKVKNMKNGVIDVPSLPKTTPEIYAKYAGAALGKGDLLISIRGSYGGVALVPDEISGANITQDSARIAPLDGIDRSYLLQALRSPICQRFFSAVAKGAAVQGVNIGDLRRTPIPLAPLAEQHRIVAKVDQLMALCDELEAKLRHRDERARKLVEAVVGEIVGAGSDGAVEPEVARAEGRSYETAEEMLARVKSGSETPGAGATKKTRGRTASRKAVTA